MTTKRKTSPWQSRRLMPAAAAAALGLVAVAMLAPLPSFDPASTSVRPLPKPQTQTIEPPAPFVPGDWSTLEKNLIALRPPPPLPIEKIVEEPKPDEGGEIEITPLQSQLPLGWTYAGRIEDETPFALVFMPNGKQRFLREGQTVTDPANPQGQAILIKQVLAETLIIERNGVEQRLPLSTTANASPTMMPGAVRPGNPRFNPRGAGIRNPASQ